MRTSALQERRNRQILADIVRTYIETGEPVSSRAISKRFEEILSTATIRNIMVDLEEGGFLYQPHTSAGRVPTAAAYRFFAQEIATQATISADPWSPLGSRAASAAASPSSAPQQRGASPSASGASGARAANSNSRLPVIAAASRPR